MIFPNRSLPTEVQFHHSHDRKTQNQSFGGEVRSLQVAVVSAALSPLKFQMDKLTKRQSGGLHRQWTFLYDFIFQGSL